MKQERNYPKFTVSKKGEHAITNGHPWVYGAEILKHEDAENGSIADVVTESGKYLGTALLSESSKIRLRIFSRNANDVFDSAFWKRRISYAWQYRKTVMAEDISCCRVIFGEADFFPGLTVDRFGSILVAQTLSLGMEKLKDIIFPLLVCVLREDGQHITAIYERNDVAIRRLEGLTESKGFYDFGEEIPTCTTTVICENNIEYEVDFENGQKTGFFLDQKYNRALVAKMAKGKRVLDCFTHTGSFALNAAYGGAAHVTAVDVSESAVEMAKKNALRNALDVNMDFIAADVFELLPALEKGSAEKYDFIILDPPAFTKSRKTATNAMRGYKEINYRAMKLLPRGGYLATCSCSHFAEETEFCKMLKSSARDAGVELRQIAVRAAAPDHPVLWNVSETQYLKFYVFQIV
ncbi:MAG: class I SAM-dependent rRNA methyltransferase [Oscillospiraceae bacterium]